MADVPLEKIEIEAQRLGVLIKGALPPGVVFYLIVGKVAPEDSDLAGIGNVAAAQVPNLLRAWAEILENR